MLFLAMVMACTVQFKFLNPLWLIFLKSFSRKYFKFKATVVVIDVMILADLVWLSIWDALLASVSPSVFLCKLIFWLYFLIIKFLWLFILQLSDFLPECVNFTDELKKLFGYSCQDLGLEIRGLTLVSNFCPTEPVVHSFLIYVQHPVDDVAESYDNHNTHDC